MTSPPPSEVYARFGYGKRIRDDVPGRVIVTACSSQEMAEAFALGNVDCFGHPSYAELRESVGWVCVCDLGPAIDAYVATALGTGE